MENFTRLNEFCNELEFELDLTFKSIERPSVGVCCICQIIKKGINPINPNDYRVIFNLVKFLENTPTNVVQEIFCELILEELGMLSKQCDEFAEVSDNLEKLAKTGMERAFEMMANLSQGMNDADSRAVNPLINMVQQLPGIINNDID